MPAAKTRSVPPATSVWRNAAYRAGVWQGLRAALPTLVPTCVWGLVAGVAMVRSGLTENMAVTMTLLVYSGTAQLTSLPLMVGGAPLWLVVAAGFVVSLRFLIFGAALHPYFRTLSWRRRLVMGYFSCDVTFVFFMSRFGDHKKRGTMAQRGFYMGVSTLAWLPWQLSSVVGIFLGAVVPTTWPLDFVAVLALMGVVLPLVKTRPVLAAALAAAAVAWAGQSLPLRLGLVVAIVAGVAAGLLAERWPEQKR